MNTKCYVCDKPLTDPLSISRGLGPECFGKITEKLQEVQDIDETTYVPPMSNGDIILLERNTCTGPRHTVGIGARYISRHSPTGLRWGYAGSGPSDLALNVLIHVTGDYAFADRHYQDFKAEFIARMQPEGGILERVIIDEWVKARRRLEADKSSSFITTELQDTMGEERGSVIAPADMLPPMVVGKALNWPIGASIVLTIDIPTGMDEEREVTSPIELRMSDSGLVVWIDGIAGSMSLPAYCEALRTAPSSASSAQVRNMAIDIIQQLGKLFNS